MLKSEIRRIYKQKRKSYSAEQMAIHSKAICELFFDTFIINSNSIKIIHSFLPIKHANEPDTFLILKKLFDQAPFIKILIPSMLPLGQMEHYYYNHNTPLIFNKMGIPEANGGIRCFEVPDLILLPLLAFDYQGYRVGYGQGYYDRYLAELPHNVIKVGLSLENPITAISDINEFDIPMDYCITPSKIFEFNLY